MDMSGANLTASSAPAYVRQPYGQREYNGVVVLVVVSCISLLAVVGLISAIVISAFNTRHSKDRQLFVRTHVAGYFISMLLTDIMEAIGSIMNAEWLRLRMVESGSFCTTQGVIKQIADVGTAVWTLSIALHTFSILFLQCRMRQWVFWTTLVTGWLLIFTLVIVGPLSIQNDFKGPFYGVTGYWCWISQRYQEERLTVDYLYMFISAFLSFVLYSLVFLKLRGNIIVNGWRIRFRARDSKTPVLTGRTEDRVLAIARQMLLYPVAYTTIILPIAATRFSTWAGRPVPFQVTIFSGTVYMLSGAVNVVLFTTTRRILPPGSILPNFSRPRWLGGSGEPAVPTKPSHPGHYYDSSTDSGRRLWSRNHDSMSMVESGGGPSFVTVSVNVSEHRPLPALPESDRPFTADGTFAEEPF